MNIINGQFVSIEQVQNQYLSGKNVKNSSDSSDISFEDILNEKQFAITDDASTVKFSKHAASRLEQRDIDISNEVTARLEDGVNLADEKGIKNSLVMVDSLAFIVNVPSRTVVTAIDQTKSDNNVFTNIDGAVIS